MGSPSPTNSAGCWWIGIANIAEMCGFRSTFTNDAAKNLQLFPVRLKGTATFKELKFEKKGMQRSKQGPLHKPICWQEPGQPLVRFLRQTNYF